MSNPPSSGPTAAAMAARPDQAPMAVLRSVGAKAPWIIARLPGVSSAPPAPCRIRATMSSSAVGARPQANEARANQMVPTTKTLRRPYRSPSAPPSRIRDARDNR